jgi:hypothetical protein
MSFGPWVGGYQPSITSEIIYNFKLFKSTEFEKPINFPVMVEMPKMPKI